MKTVKSIITLLLLTLTFSAFAQNDNNEAFSACIYPIEGEKYYVYSDIANIRSEAGTDFDIVDKLNCGDEVTVVEYDRNNAYTANKLLAGWVKISYDKNGETKEGYLWELNLSKTQLRRGDVKFVFGLDKLKPKDEYFVFEGQLKAVQNGQIVSRTQFDNYPVSLIGGSILDNAGLEGVEKVIKISFSGEACGEPMIDHHIVWDGNRLTYLIETTSVGDGGEGHVENIIFPSAYNCGSCNSVVKLINNYYSDISDESNNDPDTENSYKTEIYIWNAKKQTLKKQADEK